MSMSWWLFGLLLGMRHALEPDHLVAVSTLVVEQRRATSGALLGGLWGIGHTLALLVVATLLALAGGAVPPRLATVFELAVALMLVAMGLRSIARSRGGHRHTASAHTTTANVANDNVANDGNDIPAGLTAASGAISVRFARRSLLVGLIHGLAGSGALTALIAARLTSTPGRLFFVALFGLGSVVGMTLLSGIAGWPLARLGRSPIFARALTTGSGALALGLGIVWGLPLVRDLLS